MNLLDKYRIPLFAPEGTSSGSGGDGGGKGDSSPSGSGPASAPASSPTPSSTPPTEPSTTTPVASPPSSPPASSPSHPASSGAQEAFDFSAIFQDSPDESQAIVQPPAQVPPEVPPPVPPPATPAAQTPQAAPAKPESGTPAPPPTPQAPQAAELDRYDPGMLSQHLASNEAQALEYVAENVFKLTPQEIEALETNVVETVPKLLAKVFVKSQQNVLMQLASMVPVMIQRQTVAMQRNSENADQFYKRWPMIDKTQHGDLVMKYGAVYRQMHPTANLSQMIEDLGPMIMMAARIAPPIPGQAPPGQAANPAAQRAAGNGRSPPPSPFTPAIGAAPASAASAPEISPWEAMFREE